MVEIKKVTKTFKKGLGNKIKAINKTSLNLDDTGLVALLGPSGCGKTTLLNAIGGLDKINRGKILINNKNIASKFSFYSDRIRNNEIGYIFQDYKLLENLSVFDNVSIVLKMQGVKNKNEIKEKVEYVLEKVGMIRYKRRPAAMLSGGEKQRVAIARAIVKNPRVLLCDEPTGNLDSKNSLEVMKIIKSISKDRLVVLVTHEQNLAKFYADRIITIKDGVIEEDYKNDHQDDLDYQIDSVFYLKDMNYKKLNDKEDNVNVYSYNDEKLNINIVLKNNNIYIESIDGRNIEIVDNSSSISFVNDNYKRIGKDEILKYHFDTDKLQKKKKIRYASISNPFKIIVDGFNKVFDYPLMKKLLLIGFFASGGILMASASLIMATKQIDEKDYIKINKNYVSVNTKKINNSVINKLNEYEESIFTLPGDSNVTLSLPLNFYYQTKDYTIDITASIAPSEDLKEDDLLIGTLPINKNEIVLDILALDRLEIDYKSRFKYVGIKNYDELLGLTLMSNNNEYKIVGIAKTTNPSFFVKTEDINKLLISNLNFRNENDLRSYTEFSGRYTLKEGRLPVNDYEIIVNIDYKYEYKLNTAINQKVNDNKLVVVGYYYSPYDEIFYLCNDNTLYYDFLLEQKNISIYSKDVYSLKEKLLNDGYNANIPIETAKDKYIKNKKESSKNIITTALTLILISLIEIIFMIRSSFLSRVKEVGIYRAIGTKKTDIYKMFAGEIIAITTLTNLPAILFVGYAVNKLSESLYFEDTLYFSIPLMIFVIVGNYIFNVVIGLMPVFNTTRKKPAAILSRYDID